MNQIILLHRCKNFLTIYDNRSENDLLKFNKSVIVLHPQFPVCIGCVRLNFELEYDKERISKYRKEQLE